MATQNVTSSGGAGPANDPTYDDVCQYTPAQLMGYLRSKSKLPATELDMFAQQYFDGQSFLNHHEQNANPVGFYIRNCNFKAGLALSLDSVAGNLRNQRGNGNPPFWHLFTRADC
jgi:hypothetical protein